MVLAFVHIGTGIVMEDPFFAVIGVVGLVIAAVAARFDHWWALVPSMVAGIALLLQITFFIDMLGRVDTVEFAYGWACIIAGVPVVVFGVADLIARRRHVSRTAPAIVSRFAAAAAMAVVAVVVTSGVATITGRDTVSAEDRTGAIQVTYKDTEVEQKEISAKAGVPVRIVVENKDVWYHNFEVVGTSVKVDLGAKESKIVELNLAPGEYTYHCTVPGHGSMTGTLTIE